MAVPNLSALQHGYLVPGQERCSYPLADAFNGWYQSLQESMEVWMRYSGLIID